MNGILQGLPIAFVYIDDILVANRNHAEHFFHVCQVFECLEANGLIIRLDKCSFGLKSITSLGHEVSTHGIRPFPAKVTAIMEYPLPTMSHFLSLSVLRPGELFP